MESIYRIFQTAINYIFIPKYNKPGDKTDMSRAGLTLAVLSGLFVPELAEAAGFESVDSNLARGILAAIGVIIFFIYGFYRHGLHKGRKEAEKRYDVILRSEKDKIRYEFSLEKQTIIAKMEAQRKALAERKNVVKAILAEKEIGFPWLAGKIAEFYSAKDEALASLLETKKNPDFKMADEIRRIKADKRSLMTELRIHQYQLEYYESLFPWLLEYRDIPDEEIIRRETGSESEEDPAFQFFAPAERASFSKTELFQLALDRYVAGRKTNWEIGRDYERYIGSQLEMDGYDVEYLGARRGKEDLGRDLIAKKDGLIKVIQCKYWPQDKTIHEKHIFQLLGSAIMYAYDEGGAINTTWALAALRNGNVTPVLACSCPVSSLARSMAEGLGVTIQDNKPFDPGYPRIKCSISRQARTVALREGVGYV